MHRILVANDGSENAGRALAFAAGLAEKFGSELLVLHVLPEQQLTGHERTLLEAEYAGDFAQRVREAGLKNDRSGEEPLWPVQRQAEAWAVARRLLGERLLSSAEDSARRSGAQQVETILVDGDPAAEILTAADRNKVDIIVMGSRGLGVLGALLLGSVSEKVVHHARCTVVIVR